MADDAKSLLVVMTAGPGEPAKALLALRAALAARASGIRTELFLTLEATDWACRAEPATGHTVHETMAQLQDLGATVTCCSACAIDRCGDGGAGVAVATRPGIELVGLTTLMTKVAAGTPVITF